MEYYYVEGANELKLKIVANKLKLICHPVYGRTKVYIYTIGFRSSPG